jgi:hypothetical protein
MRLKCNPEDDYDETRVGHFLDSYVMRQQGSRWILTFPSYSHPTCMGMSWKCVCQGRSASECLLPRFQCSRGWGPLQGPPPAGHFDPYMSQNNHQTSERWTLGEKKSSKLDRLWGGPQRIILTPGSYCTEHC